MEGFVVNTCGCPVCQAGTEPATREFHHQINLICSRLDEQQRRWFVALESKKVGHGGDTLLSLITGLHVDTIRRGRKELEAGLEGRPADRVRRPGAGRPGRVKKKSRRAK
jgi:hypothetical protein